MVNFSSSPHLQGSASVGRAMGMVLLALIPVICVSTWLFGVSVLMQLAVAGVTALLAEAAVMLIRGRSVKTALFDGSALVTGFLMALCLPPIAPLWVVIIGVLFAIVVVKHLYGGLGYNLFNPAMAGYLVVLIAFPAQISLWPAAGEMMGLDQSSVLTLAAKLDTTNAEHVVDAMTMATPLDAMRSARLQDQPVVTGLVAEPLFGLFANGVTAWLALGWVAGGLLLLVTGVIRWRIPLSLLLAVGMFAGISSWLDPLNHAGVLVHLFSGGVMAAAFFIATDPVSAATTPRGQLIYGAGIGLLIYLIRGWGGFPDGVAFAVLLFNIAAPLIDYFTVPRAYGQ